MLNVHETVDWLPTPPFSGQPDSLLHTLYYPAADLRTEVHLEVEVRGGMRDLE